MAEVGKPGTPEELARILCERFEAFHSDFIAVTARAEDRFLRRDWQGHRSDAAERLNLHTDAVLATVDACGARLPDSDARCAWIEAQRRYIEFLSDRSDMELAETFYNSVTRRLFNVVGLDSELEFIWLGPTALPSAEEPGPEQSSVAVDGPTEAAVAALLEQSPLGAHFSDLDRDARLVAGRIDEYLAGRWRSIDAIDVLDAVFYRHKGAYLVGRLRWLNRVSPCILPVVHDDSGVRVDAVLLTEPAASRLFSYARSYMHVLSQRPASVVAFLKSMLPVKPVAELYTSIGYSQHGKTNLFRALFRHMEHSNTRFEHSRGAPGTVMAVFALPSFDVVFKVIKDRFPPSKRTTPEDVKHRYRLVFGYDRLGRLVDAQEFENLTFARDRFDESLLDELREQCSRTVTVTDKEVVLGHVYTERRVYPLDLYLREAAPDRAAAAAVDFGNAIKDLAKANIFPGDLFPKNFGVTRLGSVVFYDYDELALLSEVNFRSLPVAAGAAAGDAADDEMLDQPWFGVGTDDVFPEEFATYLRSPPVVGEVFAEHHREISTRDFWQSMKQRNSGGDAPDLFPYPGLAAPVAGGCAGIARPRRGADTGWLRQQVRGHVEDDLASVAVGLHTLMRGGRFVEAEAAVDDGRHGPGSDVRQHLRRELAGDGDLLLDGAGPQGGADQRRPLEHQRGRVERHRRAGHRADLHDAPVDAQAGDVAGQVVAADHVEHHVHAGTASGRLHRFGEVLRGVVDDHVRAERLAHGVLGGRRGHRDARTHRFGDLDGRRAHPRRSGVHQRPAARGEPALAHQGVPCGDEHLTERAGCTEPERFGHAHRLALMHRHPFGVPAASHDAHEGVADGVLGDSPADGGDPARELQTRYLEIAGRTRIEASALQQVGTVERRGDHVHEDLVGPAHRVGHVLHPEDLRTAVVGEYYGSHGGLVKRRECPAGRVSALAVLQGHVVAFGLAGVHLAGPVDARALLDQLVPVRQPARRAPDREQHREHVRREAQRLVDQPRVEVDVRVEPPAHEVVVGQCDLLELERNVEQRVLADHLEHVVRGLFDDHRPRS